MKKKSSIILLISIIISLNSCNSSAKITNGGYSNLSINLDSENYEISRLEEIEETGGAVFGIPTKTNKTSGWVFRFNGIEVNKTNRLIPTLSLIFNTAVISYGVNEIIKKPTYTYNMAGVVYNTTYENKYALSLLIGFPIAGAFNNLIFSNTATSVAAFNLNSNLIQKNPEIDVFLNPKYEIEYKQGIWGQEAKIKANVMGAKIKSN